MKALVVPRGSIARALGGEVDVDDQILTSQAEDTSRPLERAAGHLRRPRSSGWLRSRQVPMTLAWLT